MSNDPYNKSGYIIFLSSMALSVLFFIYISFFHPKIKGIDKNIAKDYDPQTAVKAFDLSTVEKPWISSEDIILSGRKSYKMNCMTCHGADYTGVAAMGARNLVKGQWRNGGSSIKLFKTLQTGIPPNPKVPSIMASFKHLPINERWALVHFVKSITQNKVKDNLKQLEAFAQSKDAD